MVWGLNFFATFNIRAHARLSWYGACVSGTIRMRSMMVPPLLGGPCPRRIPANTVVFQAKSKPGRRPVAVGYFEHFLTILGAKLVPRPLSCLDFNKPYS